MDVDGVPVRVIMGTAYGKISPVKVYADTLYVEAHLKAGQSIVVPDAEERAVYVAEGEIAVKDVTIHEYSMAVFTDEKGTELTAKRDSRIAIVGGENVGRRYIEWNFVSTSKERIEQAKANWKAQNFPKVVGDEEEFIPLPE